MSDHTLLLGGAERHTRVRGFAEWSPHRKTPRPARARQRRAARIPTEQTAAADLNRFTAVDGGGGNMADEMKDLPDLLTGPCVSCGPHGCVELVAVRWCAVFVISACKGKPRRVRTIT